MANMGYMIQEPIPPAGILLKLLRPLGPVGTAALMPSLLPMPKPSRVRSLVHRMLYTCEAVPVPPGVPPTLRISCSTPFGRQILV